MDNNDGVTEFCHTISPIGGYKLRARLPLRHLSFNR